MERHLNRRRFVRLAVTNEQFKLSSNGRVYGVSDLSENGLGLWLPHPEDLGLFSVGAPVEGTLNLRGKKYPIVARTRNLSKDRAGFEFEEMDPAFQKVLTQYLSPKSLGAALKPVPSNDFGTIQYVGPSGMEFKAYRKVDGQWDRFSLRYFQFLIHWDQESGLKTGSMLPNSKESPAIGIFREESLDLIQDEVPDLEKLSIAKTILVSSKLPIDIRDWCIRRLER